MPSGNTGSGIASIRDGRHPVARSVARTEEMPDPFYEDCFVKVARVEFLSDVEVGFVRYRGRSPESPSIRASLKTAPHAAYA
jgi:hypothetical protein